MEEQLVDLQDRIRALEHENAERKPVSELIKLLMYFLIGISVVLGLFGLKQFSDIREVIREEVGRQFPKDQQAYLDYEELIGKSAKLSDDFDRLFGKYKEALSNFSVIGNVAEDFDIEGKVSQVSSHATERWLKSKDGDTAALYEEPWRSNAISVLEVLAAQQEKRNFDSDFVFNAAQSANQLGLDELSFRLMKAASDKRPSDAPVRAGMLSATVDIGTEAEIEAAYTDLLGMVRTLTLNSPHIVLSEAWNATEDQRTYPDLIAAIAALENSSDPDVIVPSYAFALQAEAILRASKPGALSSAREAISKAKAKLAKETIHSLWAEQTLRQLRKVELIAAKSESMQAGIVDDDS